MFQPIVFSGLFLLFRERKKGSDIDTSGEQKDNESLLCRFVVDGKGNRLGESVSIAGDIIIIKSPGKYLGVPLKHIEEEDKSLLVKGLVDLDRAEFLGEKWRQESFCEMKNPDVKDEEKLDEF